MAQGNMKRKVCLNGVHNNVWIIQTKVPKGVKPKIRKPKKAPTGPKKGTQMILPPKKSAAVNDKRTGSTVSQVINEKNEQMVSTSFISLFN